MGKLDIDPINIDRNFMILNGLRLVMMKIFGKKAFRRLSWGDWDHMKPRFSQFGEDAVLAELFMRKKSGFYVEIGAFHPQMYSNTYNLYKDKGWSGICIEPNREVERVFRKYRPRDVFVNCGILEEEGEFEYHSFDGCGAVNTFDEGVARSMDLKGRCYKVPVRRLDRVLEEHGVKKIDLMSVDCEGVDLRVLQSNDWQRFRPEVLLVEDHGDEVDTELAEYLREQGYKFFNWVGPTKFFRDERKKAL